MNKICVLSRETIDKIAAGEVVERPSSVVKELTENAIDSGASAVTIEIRGGGIELIRVTDNGSGIEADQIRTAFLRHATSKITSAEDLTRIASLGFRGEALSSICAVSQVELITRPASAISGVRYCIEGGEEKSFEEIGAPEGSTFLIRNLFYNTPARKKFLKSAASEAGLICDLAEHLALSHPDISVRLIVNGQTKLHTSGNNNLRDIIYSIYGRETASCLLKVSAGEEGIKVSGYIAKPEISRGNRNHENYFINGRYVKSRIIARAIEDGYRSFMMQHRYPFTVLVIEMDPEKVDVNVHPAKMEVRFADSEQVYDLLCRLITETLSGRELIPAATASSAREEQAEARREQRERQSSFAGTPEPFEKLRAALLRDGATPYAPRYPKTDGGSRAGMTGGRPALPVHPVPSGSPVSEEGTMAGPGQAEEPAAKSAPAERTTEEEGAGRSTLIPDLVPARPVQMDLFDGKLLSKEARRSHLLIGQVFDTYWLVAFGDNLYIIDQHAAHEKVLYERLVRKYRENPGLSQQISPPAIVTLSMQEQEALEKYGDQIRKAGFDISHFGGREFSVSAVPVSSYRLSWQDLLSQMLGSLQEPGSHEDPEALYDRFATMACKAAVKGNTALSFEEADALIDELLGLENPYNCPHGRPTIISMSKKELEKKFHRIV